MAEEKLDVLDETGTRIIKRRVSKSKVHAEGWWHRGTNLCITDGEGNILQQLRGKAPHVRVLPGAWDLFAVAGHVPAGMGSLDAIGMEMHEELGLPHYYVTLLITDIANFRHVTTTRSNYWVDDPAYKGGGYHHRVIDDSYVTKLRDLDLSKFKLEANKVISVRWYPIDQLQRDLASSKSSNAYRQHAHRPPDDEVLYRRMLDSAHSLKWS